jgi:Protein of unknown function (DUF3788)
MAEQEKAVLADKDIYPSEELINSIIGEKKAVWLKIMSYAHEKYNDVSEEWRYYNDGKQWLFKLTRKKKTIFWLSLLKDTFRITFYFGNKGESAIMSSSLPESVKNEFVNGQRFGNIRGITTIISGDSDVDKICKLIDLKVSLK